MWTKAMVAGHQRAKAVAEEWEDKLAHLAEIAKHAPAFAERVKELQVMRDNLHQLTATALAIDPKGR